MLLESALIVVSSIAYMLLNDESNSSSTKEEIKEVDNNFTETFNYFKNLPVDYQLKYIGYNLDLQPYLDDMSLENSYLNAYKVARIAEKLNKPFTNDLKRY